MTNMSQWILLRDDTQPVAALTVALGPRRCIVAGANWVDMTTNVTMPGSVRGSTVHFAWPGGTPQPGSLTRLDVHYHEDAPHLADIFWVIPGHSNATGSSHALPSEFFSIPDVLHPTKGYALFRYLFAKAAISIDTLSRAEADERLTMGAENAANVHDTRREAMDMDDRARRFFFALDVGALSEDVPADFSTAMMLVNGRLELRVATRAALGPLGEVPIWPTSPRFARGLREMSMFVQTLIRTHLQGSGKDDLVLWAFTRFATDQLAASHPNPAKHSSLWSQGAPDGEAFFRFAELAFACIDHEIHAEFWHQHLSALVCASHVYAEHGGVKTPNGDFKYVYDEDRRYPTTRMAELRTRYGARRNPSDASALEDLFTSILGQALVSKLPFSGEVRELKCAAEFLRQSTAIPNPTIPWNSLQAFPGQLF